MNINDAIDTIVESFSSSNRKNSGIPRDKVYWKSSKKKWLRNKPSKSDWNVENSIGINMFPSARLLSIDLGGSRFTVEEINSLFGSKVVYRLRQPSDGQVVGIHKGCGKWIDFASSKVGETMFVIKNSLFLSKTVIDRLISGGLDARNITLDKVLPIHPSRVIENKHGKSFLNVLYVKEGKTFWDVFGWRPDIFWRAGKDIWGTPLAQMDVQLKVVHSMGKGHDDGVIWVKGIDQSCLVRGMIDGKDALLKGRVCHLDDWDLPPQINGVTTIDNIKWVRDNIKVGDFIKARLNVVGIEEDDVKTRKSHILFLKLSSFAKTAKGVLKYAYVKMHTMHKENALKLASRKADFNARKDSLEGMFEKMSAEDLIAKDQVMRIMTGLGSTQDIVEVDRSMNNTMASAHTEGEYVRVITRADIPSGEIHIGEGDVASRLVDEYGGRTTIVRYPVNGYLSFIDMKVVVVKWLEPNLTAINTEDGLGMGADGDDHLFLFHSFTDYKGGAPISEGNIEPISFPKVKDFTSLISWYVGGATAEALIGRIFNAMAIALDAGLQDYASELGSLLHVATKAIKKPYDLDLSPVDGLYKCMKNNNIDVGNIAIIGTKQSDRIPAAVQDEFGVQLPSLVAPSIPDWDDLVRLCGDKFRVTAQMLLDEVAKGFQKSKYFHDTVIMDEFRVRLAKNPDKAIKWYTLLAYLVKRYTINHEVKDDKMCQLFRGDILSVGYILLNIISSEKS